MFSFEVINQWGEWMIGFIGLRVLESTAVLILVGFIWIAFRKYISAQLGYWLFFIVLLKLIVPGPISIPKISWEWLPKRHVEYTVTENEYTMQKSESGKELKPGPINPSGTLTLSSRIKAPSFPLSLSTLLLLGWALSVCVLLARFMHMQWRPVILFTCFLTEITGGTGFILPGNPHNFPL